MSEFPEIFSTYVFIDTMVVLEGQPLPQLPWREIDDVGPILVLVLPQVQSEIDKRKRDGRLAERSRAFSRLIGPAVDQQTPVLISGKGVAVYLALAECSRVDYDDLDLDRDEGDHRVVGQMLNAKSVDLSRSLLISHDINPIALGIRHGLKTLRLPDHWLLSPEPSAKDKENARLKAELKELKKSEPELNIEIEMDFPAAFVPILLQPLTEQDQDELVYTIEERFDLSTRTPAPNNFLTFGSHSGERREDEYRAEKIPNYVSNLAENLQSVFNQVGFNLIVENVSPVTASNLVIEVKVVGGKFDTFFHVGNIFPPSPPKGRGLFDIPELHQPAFPQIPRIPGDHEVHWGIKPLRRAYGELHCREFRQGRRFSVEGFVEIFPSVADNFSVDVRVTASNLHGDVRKTWTQRFPIHEVHFSTLFDPKNLKLIGDYPLKARLQAAAATDSRNWIKF